MFGLNPWVLGGAGVVLAALLLFGGVQTARLDHAKADLTQARTDRDAARAALIVPNSRPARTWRQEADRLAGDLETCHGNAATLQHGLDDANAGAAAAQAAQLAAERRLVAQAAQNRQDLAAADRRAQAYVNGRPVGADRCASGLELMRGAQ